MQASTLARVVLLAVALLAERPDAQVQAAAQRSARPRALLVAVSEYPALRAHYERDGKLDYYERRVRLRGPENDVEPLRETLIETLGFGGDDIRVLRSSLPDDQPTLEEIRSGLDGLAEAAGPGELVLVYLAGHGVQVPDESGDEDDRQDEAFLPADAALGAQGRGYAGALLDDELETRLDAIRAKGARVWLLVDSYCSGTIHRGKDAGARYLPAAQEEAHAGAARGAAEETWLSQGSLNAQAAPLIALFASRPAEAAREQKLEDGLEHGRLTYSTVRALRSARGELTFRDLMERVHATYESRGWVDATPTWAGDTGLSLRSGERPPRSLRVAVGAGGRLVLNGGMIDDLESGSELQLLERGAEEGASSVLGTVRVREAGLLAAECELAGPNGGPKLVEGASYPARVTRRIVLAEPLRVHVDGQEAAAAKLREQLNQSEGRVLLVDTADEASWYVQAGERYEVGPRSRQTAPLLHDTPREAARTLERAYRAENLRRIASSPAFGGLPTGVQAWVERQASDQRWVRAEPGENLVGAQVRLQLENRSLLDWDVWAFSIATSGEMRRHYPGGSSGRDIPTVHANRSSPVELANGRVDDKAPQGDFCFLTLVVPPGGPDLSWIADDSRTRGPGGAGQGAPLEQVLDLLCFGSRPSERGNGRGFEGEIHLQIDGFQARWEVPEAPRVAFGKDAVRALRPEHLHRWSWGLATAGAFGVETSQARDLELTELYQHFAPSVFAVRSRLGHGTGFLVDGTPFGATGAALVLTNHHVVREGYAVSKAGRRHLELLRGELGPDGYMRIVEHDIPADVVLADQRADLALLQIDGQPPWLAELRPISLAEDLPPPGSNVAAIGHPASGMLWMVRRGSITSGGSFPHQTVDNVMLGLQVPREQRSHFEGLLAKTETRRILVSDCWANPGDSGGPLVDLDGRLVGVTFGGPGDSTHDKFTYHVELREVRDFLARAVARLQEPSGPVPDVPEAWDLGPNVQLERLAPAGEGFDLLVAGEDFWTTVLVDLDDAGTRLGSLDQAGVEELITRRAFDAEIAMHWVGDWRISFYDRRNSSSSRAPARSPSFLRVAARFSLITRRLWCSGGRSRS